MSQVCREWRRIVDTDQELWAWQAAEHGWKGTDMLRFRDENNATTTTTTNAAALPPPAAPAAADPPSPAEWKEASLRWHIWRSTSPSIVVLQHQAHRSQLDSLARAAAVHGMDSNLHQAPLLPKGGPNTGGSNSADEDGGGSGGGDGGGSERAEFAGGEVGLVVLLFQSSADHGIASLTRTIKTWANSSSRSTRSKGTVGAINWEGQRVAVYVQGDTSEAGAHRAAAALVQLGATVLATGAGPAVPSSAALPLPLPPAPASPPPPAGKGNGKGNGKTKGKGKGKDKGPTMSTATAKGKRSPDQLGSNGAGAGAGGAVYQQEYARFMSNLWSSMQAPIERPPSWNARVPVLPSDGMLHSLLPPNPTATPGGSGTSDDPQPEAPSQLVAWRWPWHTQAFRTLSAPTGSMPKLWWWAVFVAVTAWVTAVLLRENTSTGAGTGTGAGGNGGGPAATGNGRR